VLIGWIAKSCRRYQIHCISQTVASSAQYSASVDDRETISCFFDFHEIMKDPRKTQKPVLDLLVLGQVAQSESLKALIWVSKSATKKSPCDGLDFMYLSTCCKAR